jgi:putative inorganic carbon (hco3(-)) transporter
MPTLLAVAAPVQVAAVIAAVGAVAVALAAKDPRQRAYAVIAAPVLAVLAVATIVDDAVGDAVELGALGAAAAAIGLVVVAGLAWLMLRRPEALPLLAVAALPFRVPVSVGDSAANLLVPLYVVIAAGCVAYAWRHLRGSAPDEEREHDRLLRRLEIAFAVALVLYALQAIYSSDVPQAVENAGFFYVPFALLFRLLLDVHWTRPVLRGCFALTVGLALVFAAIGFVEFATGHLLITNAKVVEANDLKPYFRVNSLFFDPNIYGRYLALTMTLLAAVLLWTRRRREVLMIAAVLAVLWVGLVFSLSQSSFAALLVGLAVLAALRWTPWPVVGAAAAAAAVAIALVLFAPGVLNVETDSEAALDRATSGRVDLIGGGLAMVGDRPLWGFGSGAFAERYRERERVSSEEVAAASHTIPLTVTAEQGVIGLAAYLFLVACALALLFDRLRATLRERAPWPGVAGVTRAAVAAAYCGLLLHTLVYAAFLEDPLSWLLLALAAGLRAPGREEAEDAEASTNGAAPRRRRLARA